MKSILILVLSVLLSATAMSQAVHYRAYVTKKGKYVAPHVQSRPDHTKQNNYSTKGNVNPYTGKKGTRKTN
jgi:uncharacterized protein YxeA